ncbi:hypothetical protein M0R01_03835 [bacterium]|nr:hypothetical protein [bacterium]
MTIRVVKTATATTRRELLALFFASKNNVAIDAKIVPEIISNSNDGTRLKEWIEYTCIFPSIEALRDAKKEFYNTPLPDMEKKLSKIISLRKETFKKYKEKKQCQTKRQ